LLLLSPLLLAQGARHEAAPAGRHEVKLLAADGARGGGQEGLRRGAISPALEPTSDRHFFETDYPDDLHPSPSKGHLKKFDHPYPVVQDHETYDKDFVKDENNDRGEWQAQMEYDSIRTKLRGQQQVVNEAQRLVQKEKHSVEEEEREEHEAEEAEDKAKEDAEKAAEEAEKAHADVERLVGKSAADGGEEVGGSIGDAIKEVKNRTKHLEECQKQLVEAKAALQKLIKHKAKRQKEVDEAKKAKESELSAAKDMIDRANAEAIAKYDAAIAEAEKNATAVADEAHSAHEAMVEKEKELEKKVAEAQEAHEAALRAYAEEEAQIDKNEARLKEAAARVRQHRSEVDQDGGVFQPKVKSGGSSLTLCASTAGLALLAAVLGRCP